MLHETRHARQIPHDYFRRLFADENLDLLIWYKPDKSFYGFQLSYNQSGQPKALTWTEEGGFSCAIIDAGEDGPMANRSPILRPSEDLDAAVILACFRAGGEKLPRLEKEFVARKLADYRPR